MSLGAVRVIVAIAATGLAGCGPSALQVAAVSGDAEAFRSSLASLGSDVDVVDARDVAVTVLARDIQAAQGDHGRRELSGLDDCAAYIDEALAERASAGDGVAARAAMVRVESGLVPPMSYAAQVTSQDAVWRAVGARSLSLAEPDPAEAQRPTANRGYVSMLARAGKWRRKAMLDPVAEVRQAALRAAAEARDPIDERALLETARLDPDQDARLLAIRAAGAVGTRGAVLGLGDVWVAASATERVAIAHAWGSARRSTGPLNRALQHCSTSAAPRAQCVAHSKLVRTMQTDNSMAGLVAALEVLHGQLPNLVPAKLYVSGDRDAGYAAGVVERFIDHGSTAQRIEAIASAPLSWPALVVAIEDAAASPDERVAVAAFERHGELGGELRTNALARLRTLAGGDGLAALEARRVLVRLGDRAGAELLERDAKSKSYVQRSEAARGYARLGEMGQALALVVDADARVRVAASCAILGVDP